ncbi:MAG TPA: hypothetical protein VNW92_03190 [Polyangiaceae bacterium]|jgi:hypothetical protein|nr:hypothetical protein [Polyangiaceae bacterium]
MNNFSPLPASASDPRISSPEAEAPNPPNRALQARRLKLRRIVAWVIGGATLLMCAGLVRAAIRSHSEHAALALDAAPVVQAQALAPAPSTPAPSTSAQAVTQTPDPAAADAVEPASPPAKPAKKVTATTHASKVKHPAAKVSVRHY